MKKSEYTSQSNKTETYALLRNNHANDAEKNKLHAFKEAINYWGKSRLSRFSMWLKLTGMAIAKFFKKIPLIGKIFGQPSSFLDDFNQMFTALEQVKPKNITPLEFDRYLLRYNGYLVGLMQYGFLSGDNKQKNLSFILANFDSVKKILSVFGTLGFSPQLTGEDKQKKFKLIIETVQSAKNVKDIFEKAKFYREELINFSLRNHVEVSAEASLFNLIMENSQNLDNISGLVGVFSKLYENSKLQSRRGRIVNSFAIVLKRPNKAAALYKIYKAAGKEEHQDHISLIDEIVDRLELSSYEELEKLLKNITDENIKSFLKLTPKGCLVSYKAKSNNSIRNDPDTNTEVEVCGRSTFFDNRNSDGHYAKTKKKLSFLATLRC